VWGEERLPNELLVKLGIRVSPRTLGMCMPKRPLGQPRGDQRWSTFLISAFDFAWVDDSLRSGTSSQRIGPWRAGSAERMHEGSESLVPTSIARGCARPWWNQSSAACIMNIRLPQCPRTR